MSKWSDQFVAQYKETSTVRDLTKEIKNAIDKKRSQDNIDRLVSEVIKGKHKRRMRR